MPDRTILHEGRTICFQTGVWIALSKRGRVRDPLQNSLVPEAAGENQNPFKMLFFVWSGETADTCVCMPLWTEDPQHCLVFGRCCGASLNVECVVSAEMVRSKLKHKR